MRLIDNLRNAEKRSINSVRRQMEHAKQEWNDVERRIRQRMRLYPQKLRSRMAAADPADAAVADTTPIEPTMKPADPKPIISVNGQDIDEKELRNPAA
ncbi:MAG TPA: hypothetical protein VFI72_06745 [Candidatus Angelobacter sp.]|nr:hypothetical protein [Candidatus Angelobacter sp.]